MHNSRQRGVALITVLLVFVLVAVIATEMLRRSQLSLRSVGNLIETRQAYYYALGGEAYARQLLAKDAVDGHDDIDTLNEAWAKTKDQQPFEIEHGNMQVEINDLQGRFNLNSLADVVQGAPPNNTAVEQFKKLLKALQLDPSYANEWINWVGGDGGSSTDPAEDGESEDTVTAGQAEADVSALRLLPSMQPQDYAKLAPHVAVLPVNTALINVNTAADEVLQTIASPTLTAQIVAKQKTGGIRDVAEVGLDPSVASPNSSFFEVVVTVNYANRWQRVRTVLQRTRNSSGQLEITVISRVRSPLIDDLEL